ncbi:MAG: efflux RND transporter periplasmic adaptor subunit [Patescibacteria group bacterium]|nr:efflux RND transporter periplasmic adaptor subunit [Patescibacteria group bacterium]MCL5432141.1 efflux RND transporter periplasmic adaptor subunit [Patescibacteria group bacterium]
MSKKKIIIIGILLAGVAILAKFFIFKSPAVGATYTVKRETLTQTLSLSGQIAADQDEVLTFQTGGQLAWVGVKVGDHVQKYQAIASLDQRVLQKNLETALNSYLTNRWTFEQTKDNYNGQAVTTAIQRILDQSQFSLNNTVISVQLADLAKQFANLYAPFSGIVVRVDAPDPGVNVTALTTGFEIINPDSLYFSATADQTDVVNLSASAAGQITLDAYPDQNLDSRITSIAFTPKTGETGTVYEVKMTLPSYQLSATSYKLRLGMTGDVNFVTRETPDALAVPTKDIHTNPDGSKYVLVKQQNKSVVRPITIGEVYDSQTQINSGLVVGDQVIEQ